MPITADQVKQLRDMTGAGMMECKKALAENGGDFENAVDWLRKQGVAEANGDIEEAVKVLRKKGLAAAAKKAGRAAKDGLVAITVTVDGREAAMVEVNCETDFVARTEDFQQLARDLCLHIASANPVAVSTDTVAPELLERERAIYRAQAGESGKPPAVQAEVRLSAAARR